MNIKSKFGDINISKDVVAAIAGHYAVNCFGIKGMTTKSVSDGLFHLLKKESQGKGVCIYENENGGGIDIELHIACQYGANINEVCKSIISEVRHNVEKITGIDVNNIDIYVEAIKTEEVGGI